MLPRIDVTALNLIKTEVDASLTQIEGALSTFVEDNANNGPLAESVEQMEQVYGALRLIDIHG
ncbi:MAG TPA: chemotaxis protein, partial [Agitococcus sp.]|nr:chemotaxis protein [Agitococcus sp.]